MKQHKFFQDESCHWYLIPVENYGYFETLAALAEEDESIYDSEEWCIIEQYATDGPQSVIVYK